jgi:hypothetical protein
MPHKIQHQEDDTLLGVTWRDLAELGVFGRIGHLGKYAKTRQLPQVLMPFANCSQVVCQVRANSNAKSTTLTHLPICPSRPPDAPIWLQQCT